MRVKEPKQVDPEQGYTETHYVYQARILKAAK